MKDIIDSKEESMSDSPKFRSLKSSQEEENLECYRASIEGLLEENRKLKTCLLELYRAKGNGEIE